MVCPEGKPDHAVYIQAEIVDKRCQSRRVNTGAVAVPPSPGSSRRNTSPGIAATSQHNQPH